MKKLLLIMLVTAVLLCACAPVQNGDNQTTPTESESSFATEITEPELTTPPTETTEPSTEATKPPHSDLYLPQHSPQQMLEYFNEVVLNMEYSDGVGDVTLVQKWFAPIYYRYYGTPTDEDRTVLSALFAQLNAIPGFPGIYPAETVSQENLSLSFLTKKAFNDSFSSVINGEEAYGATEFWYYTASNEIYMARIGYRTDIDQVTRNSILIEEIINTLGISDTVLREDSIVYQYSNDNLALSDVDWVILRILYDPAIQGGMDAANCAAIVMQRYY